MITLSPGGSDGTPADLGRHNARLIRMRWLAGLAVMFATPFCVAVLHVPLPGSLYWLGAAILAYNVGLSWLAERLGASHDRQLAYAQFGFDWLALAVFVHLTGGIESPAIWFFLFHVLLAPLFLPGSAPFAFAGLVLVAVAGITGLEAAGWLAHVSLLTTLPPDLYRQPLWVARQLGFFTITLVVSLSLIAPVVRELRNHERRMAALILSIQAISSSLELPRVLDELVRGVCVALHAKGASIRLLDADGRELTLAASFGLSQNYLGKGTVQVDHSPMDQEALAGKPVTIQPAREGQRLQYPAQIQAEGIEAILCLALPGRQGPLGVMRIYSQNPGFFSEENINFATAFARQGATAIENAVAYGALRRTDEVKSQFVRSVTHELRAPVAGAQSLLRSVMHQSAGELSDLQRDVLHRLSARLDALQLLINDLLDLAAGKVDGLEAKLEPVAVEAVVQAVVDQLASQANEKHLALQVDSQRPGLHVLATREGLGRILINLIGNAVKYTPSAGAVRVSLRQTDAELTVAVADTGMGIPQGDIPHLFEEFHRGANAKAAGIPGTGLGLAIVKNLVERYGGRIAVQSQVGQGTTFTVTLPLAASEALAAAHP